MPLVPPEFSFDADRLEEGFRQGAKALILCNPSNPCGKVFTAEELQIIAQLAEKYDAYVITDEVYEHIVYAPYHHIYFAALPGMRERTIICSIYDNDRLVSEEIVAVLNSTDSSPAGRIQLVEIKLNNNVQSNLLKLKIFNKDKTIDYLNPLYVGDIINNTLIERDEF